MDHGLDEHESEIAWLDRLITRRYSLDQINDACHDLHCGEILGRAILEY